MRSQIKYVHRRFIFRQGTGWQYLRDVKYQFWRQIIVPLEILGSNDRDSRKIEECPWNYDIHGSNFHFKWPEKRFPRKSCLSIFYEFFDVNFGCNFFAESQKFQFISSFKKNRSRVHKFWKNKKIIIA